MIGGAYLCYEGVEKVYDALVPHAAHAHEAALEPIALDAESFEDQKVASAIKTDFILSAEIMAITLAAIPERQFWTQAVMLAVVGIGITAGGLWRGRADRQSRRSRPGAGAHAPASLAAAPLRATGRALVHGMPDLLSALGVVGTAAMIWVGGGIIVHGLEAYAASEGSPGAIRDAGGLRRPPASHGRPRRRLAG